MENVENLISVIVKGIEDNKIISMTTKKYKQDLIFRLTIGKKRYRQIITKDDYKSFINLMGNRAFVNYTKGKSNVEDVE